MESRNYIKNFIGKRPLKIYVKMSRGNPSQDSMVSAIQIFHQVITLYRSFTELSPYTDLLPSYHLYGTTSFLLRHLLVL